MEKKNLTNYAGSILHYGKQAARYRSVEPKRQPALYKEFSKSVSFGHIEQTVKDVFTENRLCSLIEPVLKRLRRGSRLTDSKKMLMFTYKVKFERLHEQMSQSRKAGAGDGDRTHDS